MMCSMAVRCIDKDICSTCPDLELGVSQLKLHDMVTNFATINDIYCTNYEKCSRLLKFLNENKEGVKDEHKYYGRDGD